ncbi:MAG: T9SS type A sorting domain-containing protein [Candidatus Delongbacteria bacterium]|nr:T9SS type A sorting domain-containing protein [Candidatus Delongbacteria bacterium]MBN2834738.1 T9SS type A sorting domain-containing protein [Candidatus Delongbacteria bacterium]
MKKIIIYLFLLILSLNAAISITENSGVAKIKMNDVEAKEGKYSLTLALPTDEIDLNVSKLVFENCNGTLNLSKDLPDMSITPFTFREMSGFTIQFDKGDEKSISDLEMEITYNETRSKGYISEAFVNSYRSIADNYETSYLVNLPYSAPRMLILGKELASQYVSYLVQWKRMKGIETDYVTLESIGSTTADGIKSYIHSRYENYETRPDYLLIIGDVDDMYQFPSFYITEENDVTDLPYTLMEGSDYLPEIIAGRISVDNPNELGTVISKIFYYEKTPEMTNSDWFKKALVVAGNYSNTLPVPTTPVEVSEWLADKLVDYGYVNVDEIYFDKASGQVNNNPAEIATSINNGTGIVTYRGWGNAHGWHVPEFKVSHLNLLNNGSMLPIVTSIVCNTADFANINVDPCFGEAIVRLGSVSAPKGAVAMVGPSDLHTNTKYNNAIFAGFYTGLLDEDNHDFGSLVLRGKSELYNNYPLELGAGDKVEFNYHVYNILGDPSISVWTDTPQSITADIPNETYKGVDYFTFNTNITGTVVTVVDSGNNLVARTVVDNSNFTFTFPPQDENFKVTFTKPNCKPLIKEISVTQGENIASVEEVILNNPLSGGSDCSITVKVKNYGSNALNNLSGTLSSLSSNATVVNSSGNFGNLSSGSIGEANFVIHPEAGLNSLEKLDFKLAYSNGTESKFSLFMNNLLLSYQSFIVADGDGILSPGETSTVKFKVKNIGSEINSLNCNVLSLNNAFTVTVPNSTASSISNNEEFEVTATISANSQAYNGKSVRAQILFTDDHGVDSHVYADFIIGQSSQNQPTGPCSYGYYAYDSNDTGFEHSPSYEWINIDPQNGGSGTVIELADDEIDVIDLPFNLKYFGQNFDHVKVCTNGWLSVGETVHANFRNWNIPAALGPYGMIAPYWDDLIGEKVGTNHNDVRISHYYDSVNNRYIISWLDCYNNFDDTSLEKFQVVITDPTYTGSPDGSSDIIFNYHTVNNPDQSSNYATVGIENLEQNDGLCYSFADIYSPGSSQLTNGLSIKFTTKRPDDFVGVEENSPEDFGIIGNYPNPFNPETSIKFSINTAGMTKLSVYNMLGEKVKELYNGYMKNGIHQVQFNAVDSNGRELASGVYMIKLENNSNISLKRALLIK